LVATRRHRQDPCRVRRASLTLRVGVDAEQLVWKSSATKRERAQLEKRPSPTHTNPKRY
jgi:hypothetical protein